MGRHCWSFQNPKSRTNLKNRPNEINIMAIGAGRWRDSGSLVLYNWASEPTTEEPCPAVSAGDLMMTTLKGLITMVDGGCVASHRQWRQMWRFPAGKSLRSNEHHSFLPRQFFAENANCRGARAWVWWAGHARKAGWERKDSRAPFPQVGIQNGDKQLGKLEGALHRNGTVLGASTREPARGFTCKSLVKKGH